MIAGTSSRSLLALTFGACVSLAAGCVNPLGPGYHFPDRQAEIRVSGASPGRIQLRVTDELVNAGDRPLHSLEVRLPEGPAFGEPSLNIKIDGTTVSPERSSLIDPRTSALRGVPREVRDLTAAARNSWLVCFDNLSRLPEDLADAARE